MLSNISNISFHNFLIEKLENINSRFFSIWINFYIILLNFEAIFILKIISVYLYMRASMYHPMSGVYSYLLVTWEPILNVVSHEVPLGTKTPSSQYNIFNTPVLIFLILLLVFQRWARWTSCLLRFVPHLYVYVASDQKCNKSNGSKCK